MIDSYLPETKILLTGFGPFLNIKTNPSSTLLTRLPSTLTHRGQTIRLLIHPVPLRAEYHYLLTVSPEMIFTHNPDAIIHIGLAADRTHFAIERSAGRDGYTQYPDMARRVLTTAEGRKIWGHESPETLEGEWEWEELEGRWRGLLESSGKRKGGKGSKGKEKGGEDGLDVSVSDDVGSYVCGLLYYASLRAMSERTDGEGRGKVLFFHVPPMEREEELRVGDEVLVALIKAVAESLEV